MKALVFNNEVIDIQTDSFEVHPSMSWIDCDSSVEVGFTYDGSSFISNVIELTQEQKLESLRAVRNRRLAETDWWASSDLTMTEAQTAYRQALRDITETYTSLDDVVWPEKP